MEFNKELENILDIPQNAITLPENFDYEIAEYIAEMVLKSQEIAQKDSSYNGFGLLFKEDLIQNIENVLRDYYLNKTRGYLTPKDK
jgi:5-methylcytosine-specific restriction endonuclease McrBC regulatory subunit McrC